MTQIHTDLSRVPVAVAPSPATSGTTLKVLLADSAKLPDVYPWWAGLVPTGQAATRTNTEISKVTGASDDATYRTYTIVRAQGIPVTTAQSITTGFDIYDANSAEANIGLNALIINETPSGTVNGSNTVFDTAQTYVAGSIQVYRDGQLLKGGGDDYTETDSNTITFTQAPATGSVLLVTYQHTVSTTGNADTLDGYHANATPTASNIPVLDSGALLPIASIPPKHVLNAQQGFLINGKIVPSVASNNLTVAIKGLDGNDPSATNPVYCRIGDTVRSITAALSVTKNAGTMWFNAGTAELATKEIDYFVYLGYNATDGVVIGFSRIPYAREYDDFSTTSTNEKYCAISTITNAAAGDDYEVIGRFAAVLSGGAGYTWSVPTFTNKNLIQRPIFNTRDLSWTPTQTWTNAPTSQTVNAKYIIDGTRLSGRVSISGTANGSNAGTDVAHYPPFQPEVVSNYEAACIIGGAHWSDTATFTDYATGYFLLLTSKIYVSFTTATRKPTRFAVNFEYFI